jgi:hypothetical protein
MKKLLCHYFNTVNRRNMYKVTFFSIPPTVSRLAWSYICFTTSISVDNDLSKQLSRLTFSLLGSGRTIRAFNLWKPTGYGIHQLVEHFSNSTLCPYCIYVFCICLRTNSDLCHLHKKLIGFITQMKSVYIAVRTGALNEAVCAPSFKG